MPRGVYIRTAEHLKNFSNSVKGKIPWNKSKKFPETTGDKHHLWKGDSIGYSGIHKWIQRTLGNPKICWECNITTARKYEWANISGEYLRDIKDWKRLCTLCHAKLDILSRKRGENHYNAKVTKQNVIEIRNLYKTGNYTLYELGKKFNICFSAVSHIISRRNWKNI